MPPVILVGRSLVWKRPEVSASAEELKDYNSVQTEARSEDLYREMESAASSQDWERARKLLNVLTTGATFFGKKAAEKAEAITAGYVNLHIAAAGLMKGKDNAGCLAEAQLALQANPQSADAQSLVDACKSAPAVSQSSVAPPSARTASLAPRSSARTGGDDSEARRLVNDGNQKLIAQDPSTPSGRVEPGGDSLILADRGAATDS